MTLGNLIKNLLEFVRRILIYIFPGNVQNVSEVVQERYTLVGMFMNSPLLMLFVSLFFIGSIIGLFNKIRRLI